MTTLYLTDSETRILDNIVEYANYRYKIDGFEEQELISKNILKKIRRWQA